jgi:hypothetical protein
MRWQGPAARAVMMIVIGALLVSGRLAPTTFAQDHPDESDVVLVLDFSASILDDAANRDRFAAALDRIADRIDATASDLVAGDTTVTIVQFATRAAEYPGCQDLELIESPETVGRLADCVREAAAAYRDGLNATLTAKIGVDTNYVAAMTVAERHLPAGAVRPALILFTDGKHDVAGVPVSQVQPARDRFFGERSPFALLPVGMGLSPAERPDLESGLVNLRIIREMPACASGSQFEWPQVVFDSPAEAGNAVAVALQNVTCTFTVAPTPTPSPTPTPLPEPTPDGPRAIGLTPGDSRIEVNWIAPATSASPIVDYRVRCRSGEEEWTESTEGMSTETSTVVEGLTNGVDYQCEVMAVAATTEGAWTVAPTSVTPGGRPAPPAKPAVQPLDGGVRVQVPASDPSLVTGYRFECSGDEGRTWPAGVDVVAAGTTSADIGNLTNGSAYVCRAFAANGAGVSDPSAMSDVVRPCGSVMDCNPVVVPVLGVLGVVLFGALLALLVSFYRDRSRGYVVAVVDVVHTANLGYGSRLGMSFVRAQPRGPITGIVSDRSRKADLRIRLRGNDEFEVKDGARSYVTTSGEPVITVDSVGARHSVILRRFRGATAAVLSDRG